MILAAREANRIVTNMKCLGIIKENGLIADEIYRGKYLVSNLPVNELENRADRTQKFIKQISINNGYNAEISCSQNMDTIMDDIFIIITISMCSPALNDDLASWCQLHNKLSQYCPKNNVFALVV